MRTLVKRGRQLADWVILERKMYTILTVEDDLHINNLLKEALGKAGYVSFSYIFVTAGQHK